MNKHGKIPAVFMRGGTSKALMFHERDLPADRSAWDAIFLAAMGSPDPNGRQLNGMGGGVTSVSKVCVIGLPSRDDADVDYTFAQVLVKEARVSYKGNCGNMSAAIGPFAVDEELVAAFDGEAVVRIHNTNTKKIIRATFSVMDGRAAIDGDLAIPGVAGTGSPVKLDFLDLGGADTGRLLPTGNVVDRLSVDGLGEVEVSIVDAANPCVFIDATSLGMSGVEMPELLERDAVTMEKLISIGAHAAIAMGFTGNAQEARKRLPLIGVVTSPQDNPTLSGEVVPSASADLVVRMLSSGQPHRALPVTGSICAAVAARIPGTIPHRLAQTTGGAAVRLAMPSGVITVDASVHDDAGTWRAGHGTVFRTARRLFDGSVYF
ncbi:2-methylaconitate cis-trans isomerase PrpF family protein [Polaromonas glacialis]|uniref:2-methylaconitate cis-trans isomerase PrpF family protein n=1 Tax=Polaromonas glacialis TaxID=866564 RepID=UPI00049582E8|nr:PrpF domain-containing protein [Polaromonas glacialis]